MVVPILLLTAIASGCLVFGVYLLRQPNPVETNLTGMTVAQAAPKPSYFERGIRPRSERLARALPFLRDMVTPSNIEERIIFAGSPYHLTGGLFYGMQLFAGMAAAVFGFPLGLLATRSMQGGLLGLLVLGAGGILYPVIWLNGQIQKRQFEITLAVPDALDLLAASIEAGLGFDLAMHHVVSRTQGPLTDELNHFLWELQMGTPRAECFRHIIARNTSKELRTLMSALLQAQELGAPVSKTLQDQAEEMRVQRVQRAKEAGAQASPKISVVTTVLIAPAVMCMFFAVLAYHLWTSIEPFLRDFAGGR